MPERQGWLWAYLDHREAKRSERREGWTLRELLIEEGLQQRDRKEREEEVASINKEYEAYAVQWKEEHQERKKRPMISHMEDSEAGREIAEQRDAQYKNQHIQDFIGTKDAIEPSQNRLGREQGSQAYCPLKQAYENHVCILIHAASTLFGKLSSCSYALVVATATPLHQQG